MRRFLQFCADYWFIPVLVVGAAIALIVWPSRQRHLRTVQKIDRELKAIDAKREVRDIQLQLGSEQAKQHVREKYAAKRAALDALDSFKAEDLEDDPIALAHFLERHSRGVLGE